MAEEETAATTPPQMAEHLDSTVVQPPTEEEELSSPIRPDSGEETAVRPETTEAHPQIGQEEEPPVAEEDDAATTRPESGEETALGSEPEEEITHPHIGEEEEAPVPEEDSAAAIRPGSGEKTAVRSEPEVNTTPIEIASDEENAATVQPRSEGEKASRNQLEPIRLELPTGRVKKIMKLDTDINKINAEALHLVSCSTQLFLQFLAEGSGEAAAEKKRKIVKLEHIMTAAKRHRATRDFLVDELPVPAQPSDQKSADRSRSRPVSDRPASVGTRRIDDFFSKPATKSPIEVEES